MIRLRLQYDRYNGTFTLVDRELRTLLEDGALYDMVFTLPSEDEDEQSMEALEIGPLAHA